MLRQLNQWSDVPVGLKSMGSVGCSPVLEIRAFIEVAQHGGASFKVCVCVCCRAGIDFPPYPQLNPPLPWSGASPHPPAA